MAKKPGRPVQENKEEIIVRARFRLDNDPLLKQFSQMLKDAPNRADIIREAARVYVAYQNGEMGEFATADDAFIDDANTVVSVDDIFSF